MHRLFKALSRHSVLTQVNLHIPQSDNKSLDCISVTTLRPLLALRHLTKLRLGFHLFPVHLTDSDVEEMCNAWPLLECLNIIPDVLANQTPGVPFHALAIIAEKLPRLRYLALMIDLSGPSENLDLSLTIASRNSSGRPPLELYIHRGSAWGVADPQVYAMQLLHLFPTMQKFNLSNPWLRHKLDIYERPPPDFILRQWYQLRGYIWARLRVAVPGWPVHNSDPAGYEVA